MEDPRTNRYNCLQYPFEEILFLVISAAISGIDGWVGVQIFGNGQIDWLRKFFPFENGIPSHDTLGRIFARLDNDQFGSYFIQWISRLHEFTEGEVVAIDGKRMRGSYDKSEGKAALHMVSAYATQNCLSLGQLACEKKKNEITTIPKLLDLLTLKGCIVTIDAMGCQKAIAKKIIDQEADYILQVKDHQKGLLEQIEKVFNITQIADRDQNLNADHGRLEERICEVIHDLRHLDETEGWTGLRSIVRITATRINKRTRKKEENTRYYISSRTDSAKTFNVNIRSHWSIENKLHWVLDVTFHEDKLRKRKGDSAANFGLISKIALTLIEKNKGKKSRPQAIKKAAFDTMYRETILGIIPKN